MRRDGSARSAGNASITSSSSARPICAGSLSATPATTTNCERICPWGRIRRAVDRRNGSASSLLSPSWAGFTINIAGCSFRQAHVLAVAPPLDNLLEQPLEPLLALDERQLSGALAIQVQKIEGKEYEL